MDLNKLDLSIKSSEHEKDGVKVTLEYTGEGWYGDYDPEDPEDTPLLRMDVYRYIEDEWVYVEDSSYCTAFPATEPQEKVDWAAKVIYDTVYSFVETGIKRLCEELSWISPEDYKDDLD